jgi:hypothetical protein
MIHWHWDIRSQPQSITCSPHEHCCDIQPVSHCRVARPCCSRHVTAWRSEGLVPSLPFQSTLRSRFALAASCYYHRAVSSAPKTAVSGLRASLSYRELPVDDRAVAARAVPAAVLKALEPLQQTSRKMHHCRNFGAGSRSFHHLEVPHARGYDPEQDALNLENKCEARILFISISRFRVRRFLHDLVDVHQR